MPRDQKKPHNKAVTVFFWFLMMGNRDQVALEVVELETTEEAANVQSLSDSLLSGKFDRGELLDEINRKEPPISPAEERQTVAQHGEYIETISNYKGSGLELWIADGVIAGQDNANLLHRFTRATDVYELHSPTSGLLWWNSEKAELPPELRHSSAGRVVPLAFISDWVDEPSLTAYVRLEDHLLGDIIFEKNLPVESGRGMKISDSVLTELGQEILGHIAGRRLLHEKALQGIAPNADFNERRAIFLRENSSSTTDRVALQPFLESSRARFAISVMKKGIPREESPFPSFTSGTLETANWNTMVVRGQIIDISLSRDLHGVEVNEKRGTIDGKPMKQEAIDQFGNKIFVDHFPEPNRKDQVRQIVNIRPPIYFADYGEENSGMIPAPFDLSIIGGGVVQGLFTREPEYPFHQEGPYLYYTNMKPEDIVDQFAGEFSEMRAGAEQVEELFGVLPGSQVRQFYIFDSDYDNAHIDLGTPSAIQLRDEILNRDDDIHYTMTHEAFHVMDLQGESVLREDEVERLFKMIENKQPKFFRDIAESNFIRDREKGGHPRDSAAEFVASFLNSLIQEGWRERMEDFPNWRSSDLSHREFLITYRRGLEAVEAQVERLPDSIPAGPLKELIRERQKELRTIIREARKG